jgi:hypothetical protein
MFRYSASIGLFAKIRGYAKSQTATCNLWCVFYNVFSGEWESLPVEIDEDEIIENYFEDLDPELDRETIEGIITKLQALLEKRE